MHGHVRETVVFSVWFFTWLCVPSPGNVIVYLCRKLSSLSDPLLVLLIRGKTAIQLQYRYSGKQ